MPEQDNDDVGQYEDETKIFTASGSFSNIKEAALFNTTDTGILSRNVFAATATEIENTQQQPELNITWTLGIEPYIPTRWDKIRNAISNTFHPITKYRLRLVNTDYEGWD